MSLKKTIDALTKDLMDKGLIVEAGWVGLKLITLPRKEHEEDMKAAFFAGAMHVFTSMIAAAEGNNSDEPTENEQNRMTNLNNELEKFGREFCRKHGLEAAAAMYEKPEKLHG
jgi:hypothetical protein